MLCSEMLRVTVRHWNSHIFRTAETILATTHTEGQENLRTVCGWSELCGTILVKDLCTEGYCHIGGGGGSGKKEKRKSSNQVPLFPPLSYFQDKIQQPAAKKKKKKTGEKKCTFVPFYTPSVQVHAWDFLSPACSGNYFSQVRSQLEFQKFWWKTFCVIHITALKQVPGQLWHSGL